MRHCEAVAGIYRLGCQKIPRQCAILLSVKAEPPDSVDQLATLPLEGCLKRKKVERVLTERIQKRIRQGITKPKFIPTAEHLEEAEKLMKRVPKKLLPTDDIILFVDPQNPDIKG